MIFVDASFFLSLLNSNDSDHKKAAKISTQYQNEVYVTSQAVLGEVLTVGSQRIDKKLTIKFVEQIIRSDARIVLENRELVDEGLSLFKKVGSKNISWVDCYSLSIMRKLRIKEALTFDRHFKLLSGIDSA